MKSTPVSSVLEALELRLAPAGIVSLSTAGGVLTITGDSAGSDNAVRILEISPGLWRISDPLASGTTFSLNGAAAAATVDITAASGIKTQLGAGNDALQMLGLNVAGPVTIAEKSGADVLTIDTCTINGSVKIDTGSGDDILTLNNNHFNSPLNVKTGTGNDFFNFAGNITRDVNVDLGSGSNNFTANATELTIFGNLNVTAAGGVAETNNLTLAAATGLITGNVKLTVKAGNTTIEIGDISGDTMLIAGNLTFQTGHGLDNFTLNQTLTVGGLFSVKAGNGDNTLLGQTSAPHILGGFSYTGGTGSDIIEFTEQSLHIGSNISVNLGSGSTNRLSLTPTDLLQAEGNITYKGGTGADTLRVDSTEANVLGQINFNAGNGSNVFHFLPENGVLGSLTYKGGTSTDIVRIGDFFGGTTALVSVLGKVNINVSKDYSEISLTNSVLYSSVNVTAASHINEFFDILDTRILGTVNYKATGVGLSIVDFTNSTFFSAVTLDTGKGNDFINFDIGAGTSLRNTFQAPVKILMGDGDDVFTSGTNPTLANAGSIFNALLTVDGGKGTDTASLLTGYNNTFGVAPDIKTTVETQN